MNRTKYFALNTTFTMMNQIIIMIAGFITPRIMLVYFGSSVNGLVSSITQFIIYFNLVEAGLANASIFALYKPIAENNIDAINGVVSATKKYYYQAGYIFTGLIVALSLIYPFFVSENSLSTLEISFLVLLLGGKGFLDFFSLAKYRALLTASQQVFVISISSSVYTILNTIIIVTLAYFKQSILAIYFFSLFALFSRNLILSFYVKKKFPNVNFDATPNVSALSKRWDALILQLVGLAQNSAPTIIITFFLTLKDVSVYAIFNMVISGIQGVLGIFTNSLASAFGDLIARDDKSQLQKVYNEFEFIYLFAITIIYIATFNLLQPFVNIYTTGVTDANYNLPIVSFLFALNGLLYIIKTPQGMIINSAGHFKETKGRAFIQALIIIIVGLALIKPLGLVGILSAMCLSNLYRAFDMFIYVPKYITKSGYKYSLKNYSLMLVVSIISQILISLFVNSTPGSYLEWVVVAIQICIISIFCATIICFIFSKENMFSIVNRLKSVINLK